MTEQFGSRSPDIANVARGLLMGGADIIPGVSGGTVALILGIYEHLVTSISRFDTALLGHLRGRRWGAAAEHVHLRFLLTLGAGIALGIALLGSVMHYLLEHHQQVTLGAFFGLIAASSVLVARMVGRWSAAPLLLLVAGAVFAFWLVGLPGLQQPPGGLGYVFLCGCIAICAMILPGISGAFVLLILGKYHDITGIIKDTLRLQITTDAILTVAAFGAGCVVGLLSFSKCLRWLLGRHEAVTMATLCGFMAGSLRRIWPFQVDVSPAGVTEYKDRVFQPMPLQDIPMDGKFWVTLLVCGIAFASVFAIDRVSRGHDRHPHLDTAA